MKLSTKQLKKILKECIVELIEEGAFNQALLEGSKQTTQRPASDGFIDQSSSQPDGSVGMYSSPNERLRDLARQTAQMASGGDKQQASMLENIFADTAKTTYQRHIANDGGGAAGGTFVGEQADPETQRRDNAQLQALQGGHEKNHWAKLAFGKYEKK